jgi:hypothetical protein|uniref:Uncharacterized protein n=1 Tax=viral metagenome TaxID=1070528 RepID=A0A6C0BEX0_9ZZZZ
MLDLVVLCASHIATPDRILSLKTQIQSIMAQTHPVPMYVSISGIIPFDIKPTPILHIYHHPTQKKPI